MRNSAWSGRSGTGYDFRLKPLLADRFQDSLRTHLGRIVTDAELVVVKQNWIDLVGLDTLKL
jgi:hypothetical protein